MGYITQRISDEYDDDMPMDSMYTLVLDRPKYLQSAESLKYFEGSSRQKTSDIPHSISAVRGS